MKCINVLLSHIIVISILILFEEVYAYMRMVNKIIKNIYDIVENSDPYELMDKSEIISFDIYDTLLQRDVAKPTDLFVFLEKELVKQNYAAYGFAECRIKAEKLAAKKYGEFTTLENIYDEISNINPEFSKRQYRDFEVDLEYRLTSLRQDMHKLYMRAIETGKSVFLISDMYLPEKVISKLLMANGIKGYKELFVSCEYGVSKRNGDLFELVKRKNNIRYETWLHIGDNIISDWLVPRKKGICAYNIDSQVNYLHNIVSKIPSYSFEIRQLYKYIQNRLYAKDDYYKIGYGVFGPLLYSVTKWIHENIQADNADIILFAARDGYLFEKSYNEIPNRIEAKYILVSRKSLMLPMMSMNLQLDLYLNLFFPNLPKNFSIEFFLDKLGFLEEDIGRFFDAYDYPIGVEYDKDELLEAGKFQIIYSDILVFFRKKISAAARAFHEYLDVKYLKDKKIAFFDIGVRGTIQKCLEIILNKDINGYYLYVDKREYNLKYANGYIANGDDVCKYVYFYNLLEIVFSAPHGSAKSYVLSDNGSKAICSKYENFEKNNYLNDIRKAALIFNKDATKDNFISNIGLSFQDYFSALKLMGVKPSKDVMNLLGKFNFSNGNGITETFIRESSITSNVYTILKDYKLSAWKIGFLYSRFYLLGKFIPLGRFLIIFGVIRYKINIIKNK